MSVTLTNTGALPIPWVLVEDLLPDFAVKARTPRLTVKGKRIHVVTLRGKQTKTIKYKVTFAMRGYYPLGPTLLETGDVFGLHRRHRVIGKPVYVMVYPKVVPLPKYDFASERPIGEIRLQNRLFEDPTRTAGVRQYVIGDPLQRVHWKVTARTGELHCRIYEPTTPRRRDPAGGLPRGRLPRARRAAPLRTRGDRGREHRLRGVGAEPAGRAREQRPRRRRPHPRRSRSPRNRAEAQAKGYATREEARERFELNEDERPHSAGGGGDAPRVRPVPEDPRGARPARTLRRASRSRNWPWKWPRGCRATRP